MAKINVVLTDTDELYLNRLASYLIEKADSFNVSSFTSKDILYKYLSDKNNKVDVLILPVDFADEKIKKLDIAAKIILSDGTYEKLDGFESVNKYQKADKFISDILLTFAEKTGRTDAIKKGNKNTKVIGVYSPVGGCGKTTIALSLSMLCANSGLKVFYLNFEKVNSSDAFFPKAPSGSLSDVFLALKTKGTNIGLKIISNQYTDPSTKISYINSPDSAMEYDELTESEVSKLIHEFDVLGEYDVVIIDMNSSIDKYNINIMSCCDKILMPFNQDSLSITKMSVFLNEFNYHENIGCLCSKIHLIANKTDSNGANIINGSSIVQFKPIEVYLPFSPVFTDVKNLSYNGTLNQSVFATLLNIIMH